MSLKMECHSKWNVAQNGMLLKLECQLKIECLSTWNVTKNGMSLKVEFNLKLNFTLALFPDKKRIFNSPLPESWILSPEAMNPDLESIINQTKYCMPFSFSHEHFLQSWTIKSKDRSLGWDQFSRNKLFSQLCRPLGVITHSRLHTELNKC